jgi:hypothetical protein
MRCEDCGKFVSFDTEVEPEVEDEQIDGDHENGYAYTASVRRVLQCAECNGDMKETTFDIEQEVVVEGKCEKTKDGNHEFSVESAVEPTERTQTTDRNGKRIKSSRYMKHFYGVSGSVTGTCEHCDIEVNFTFEDESQASSFDEC